MRSACKKLQQNVPRQCLLFPLPRAKEKTQTPPLSPGPDQFQLLGCLTYSGALTRRALMEAGN